jgi:LPXTG-motif cell wall-anchored protein
MHNERVRDVRPRGRDMGRRIVTTVAAVLFAVGLTMAPATSQEGFTLEECLAAIVAGTGDLTDAQIEELVAFLGTTPDVDQLEAFLQDLLGDPGYELPDVDAALEACEIYLVGVFPDDEADLDGDDDARDDRGDADADDNGDADADDGEVADGVVVRGDGDTSSVPPARTGLPVTGSDLLVLSVVGLVILSLGYLALRRTRHQSS